MNDLHTPRTFTNPEGKARKLIEVDAAGPMGLFAAIAAERERRYAKPSGVGRWRCGNPECRKDYTATTGTVMRKQPHPAQQVDDGLLPHVGFKEGRFRSPAPPLSRRDLQVRLGSWPTASAKPCWTRPKAGPLGGEGKIVEADETYLGKSQGPRSPKRRPSLTSGKPSPSQKRVIVALVERGGTLACSMSS